MRYRLIVLTHGEADTLGRCLASFARHVTPQPVDAYMHMDGQSSFVKGYDVAAAYDGWRWTLGQDTDPTGFCAASRECWDEGAAHAGADELHDYVFWLEHDFLFLRDVDLRELAAVLDRQPQLAQMALMRDAVSDRERAAGGLYESRPDEYLRRQTWAEYDVLELGWLEHRSYFTTNPSLMRRDFMIGNRWPDYPEQCEGRFGLDLVASGYSFGAWGSGEPWVAHVGRRGPDGHGY